mmetsp:Transcript_78842/g.234975  ORF Transcript_78842/g.234975 Transcript_78842/m.234975 type:complete len:87 (-) Transcript_78842:420-680(-)
MSRAAELRSDSASSHSAHAHDGELLVDIALMAALRVTLSGSRPRWPISLSRRSDDAQVRPDLSALRRALCVTALGSTPRCSKPAAT